MPDDDLHKWRNKVRQGNGLKALASRKATGRRRTLTVAQESQGFRWINGKDPRQYGFDFGLWTRQMVGHLIENKLAARAKKLKADIYFWDEAGFRADAVQGRT